ncbi:MAG TPA: hypothetical protein VLA79_12600 [Polyangia bacterium]|nr:hypothetical protein [Polyangia bacterium]
MDLDLDPDAGEAVALAAEIARFQEAREERDELLLDLAETRASILWLEAELRGLRTLRRPAARKRQHAQRPGGMTRAVWAAAGAVAIVATLWVLR